MSRVRCKLTRTTAGSVQEERAWKLLLLGERLLFLAPLRLQGGRRGRDDEDRLDKSRLVRERAGALLRREWAGLLAEARRSTRGLARSRAKDGAAQRDESYLADEVVRKVLAEEHSRAAALLASPCSAGATDGGDGPAAAGTPSASPCACSRPRAPRQQLQDKRPSRGRTQHRPCARGPAAAALRLVAGASSSGVWCSAPAPR